MGDKALEFARNGTSKCECMSQEGGELLRKGEPIPSLFFYSAYTMSSAEMSVKKARKAGPC